MFAQKNLLKVMFLLQSSKNKKIMAKISSDNFFQLVLDQDTKVKEAIRDSVFVLGQPCEFQK